jgi:hypothetical protein
MGRGQILAEKVLPHLNGVDNYTIGAHWEKTHRTQ